MRIKSYFAESIQHAMERARVDLGSEAMLLNSKKTDSDLRHLGQVEVVFGVNDTLAAANKPDAPKKGDSARPEQSEILVRELADLRRQIETMQQSVTSSARPNARGRRQIIPEIEDIYSRLIGSEVSVELAEEITEAVEIRVREQSSVRSDSPALFSPERVNEALVSELQSRILFYPELGKKGAKHRTVMFVGPAGCGKTTTLVKLALKAGARNRAQVQLFSADTLRVGGWEQLKTYAGLAGFAFQKIDSLAELKAVIEPGDSQRLVLIDTPGYADADMVDAKDLAAFASSEPDLEVQLVLPANVGCKAGRRISERFAIFKPSRVIFTHVDDGCAHGSILELALRVNLPVSFLTTGQQIPDDIKEASLQELTGLAAPAKLAAISAA